MQDDQWEADSGTNVYAFVNYSVSQSIRQMVCQQVFQTVGMSRYRRSFRQLNYMGCPLYQTVPSKSWETYNLGAP